MSLKWPEGLHGLDALSPNGPFSLIGATLLSAGESPPITPPAESDVGGSFALLVETLGDTFGRWLSVSRRGANLLDKVSGSPNKVSPIGLMDLTSYGRVADSVKQSDVVREGFSEFRCL